MAKKEFMEYVEKRQAKQREREDKEVFAYFKQSYIKKRAGWGIKFGGYRR